MRMLIDNMGQREGALYADDAVKSARFFIPFYKNNGV